MPDLLRTFLDSRGENLFEHGFQIFFLSEHARSRGSKVRQVRQTGQAMIFIRERDAGLPAGPLPDLGQVRLGCCCPRGLAGMFLLKLLAVSCSVDGLEPSTWCIIAPISDPE
jgi:hypothetical protein